MLTRSLVLILIGTLTAGPVAGSRADERPPVQDHRARIVESTLKDMSTANDTAVGRQGTDPVRSSDPLGAPRVRLQPPPGPDSATLVHRDVQSSLHRLRRETVSTRIEDDRKAIVDETLSRQSETLESTREAPAANP